MAKVLLVQPHRNLDDSSNNRYCPPTSLIYLGTAIKNKHQVVIYDRNNERDNDLFFKKFSKSSSDFNGYFISRIFPEKSDIIVPLDCKKSST